MSVVVPKIPDSEFRDSQALKLKEIEDKINESKNDGEVLKKILMQVKGNVFNLHLKYPTLKQLYDQADTQKVDLQSEEKDIYSEKNFYELKKKQAELKLKKLQALENATEDDENEEQNRRIKSEFIGKHSIIYAISIL